MQMNKRSLQASAFGNFMEWFDFTLYGFFALAIGANFFPAADPMMSAMASYAAFAAGFIARPLGAYYLGRKADSSGRKAVLMQTLLLMGLAVLMVVVAPSYSKAEMTGSVMVVAARLLAGFAAAGETGAAAAMAIEEAPPNLRGRWGGLFTATTYLGVAAASGVAMLCYGLMGTEVTNDWGWRVGYASGLFIVPVGIWVRSKVPHSKSTQSEATKTIASPWSLVFRVAGLTAFGSAVFYVVIVFMPVYASKALGIPMPTAMTVALASSAITAVFAIIGGMLSDLRGRKLVMIVGLAFAVTTAPPSFANLLSAPSFCALAAFQWSAAAALGLFAGAAMPLMVESFPQDKRAWGVGLGYSVGVMLFGAMAPTVNTLALSKGVSWAPLAYILLGSAVTWASLKAIPEPRKGMYDLV